MPTSFRPRTAVLPLASLLLVLLAVPALAQPSGPVDPRLYAGLNWRNIGPFRGGRVSAVTGAIGQPGVFYVGLPSAACGRRRAPARPGIPVFDAVKEASSVGAMEVAPSDPNVIYVGMGDLITGGGNQRRQRRLQIDRRRQDVAHLGLDDTKQIPSILVDPKDPNIVLVAAQGNSARQEQHARRVPQHRRRQDVDARRCTWTIHGRAGDRVGVRPPDVMLATTVAHYSHRCRPRRRRARGAAGGAGARRRPPRQCSSPPTAALTWKEIAGAGCRALTGRTSIAVAMNTNAQRMFLIGNFGLYRSDDGGATWRQMARERRRAFATDRAATTAASTSTRRIPTSSTRSTRRASSRTDGGNTFTGFKGAPGGDDPQQMWIDPTNGKRMLLGVDQGATVSLDGGETWSSWYNQSTDAGLPHLGRQSYPYWVYATQQDAGAIAHAQPRRPRRDHAARLVPDPGYEFGSIVADPLNPKIVYAGGPDGGIVKITYPSGQWINVSPNVGRRRVRLRKVGNPAACLVADQPARAARRLPVS